MAEDTIEGLRAERDSVRAELDTLKGELSGAKDRIKELNSENGGHRSNYQREKKAREDAQSQLEAVTSERDGLVASHVAEMERQRIDLTAKSADVERRANETIETYKGKRADMSLSAVATRLGMGDLDGLKLLDRSGLRLTDDGDVENADEMMAALKETKPYLFTSAALPGTVTRTTTTTTGAPRQAAPANTNARTMTREDAAAAERALLQSTR